MIAIKTHFLVCEQRTNITVNDMVVFGTNPGAFCLDDTEYVRRFQENLDTWYGWIGDNTENDSSE